MLLRQVKHLSFHVADSSVSYLAGMCDQHQVRAAFQGEILCVSVLLVPPRCLFFAADSYVRDITARLVPKDERASLRDGKRQQPTVKQPFDVL